MRSVKVEIFNKRKSVSCEKILCRRKIGRAILQVFVVSILFSVWVIGTHLLVFIDSNINTDNKCNDVNNDEDARMVSLLTNIQDICSNDNKKESLNQKVNKTEANILLASALKMKTLRENVLLFPELGQMWCLVPKAASTTWSQTIINAINSEQMNIFVDLDEKTTEIPLQVILKQNYGFISKNIYEESLNSKTIKKILLVRHPFARIISAYENKLNNRKALKDGMYFFQHFGVKINRKFRKNKKLKKKEPTFAEFVQYLIETDPKMYDEHWKPISLLCGVCQVNYDLVIKVEDLPESACYYMNRLGFASKGINDLPQKNASKNSTTVGKVKGASHYFSNITQAKVIQLYEKYEADFKMFQYSLQDYFSISY